MINQAITGAIIVLGLAYIVSNENQRSRYFPEHFFDHSFNDTQAKVIGLVLIVLGLYMNSMARFQIVNIPLFSRGGSQAKVVARAYSAPAVDIENFI